MEVFFQIRKFSLWLFRLLFPPACPLCGGTFLCPASDSFCLTCLSGFKSLPEAHCSLCSLPFEGQFNSSHLCGRCTKQAPSFYHVFAVGLYGDSLRYAIHQFKFNHKIGLDRSLGIILERSVPRDLDIDLVVPVPLHRKRLQQRSYNQALLLAREFSRIRKVPVSGNVLRKVRDTDSQQGLSAQERIKNLDSVFELQGTLSGKTILLVDDVMTTGATVEACSRVLLEGGAKTVYVGVIGRAA